MPEIRAIKAVAPRIADGAKRRNHERGGVEGLTDSGIRQRRRRDLVGTRRAAADSVEYGITESGEVVGNCEGAAGVPDQNAVGLPANERHLLGSIEVFSEGQLIGDASQEAVTQIEV